MSATVEHRYLFNFAVSRSEGGYKRLHAYARWFNAQGGAHFIIHPHCETLRRQFPSNRFFVVSRSNFQRLFDDWTYLEPVRREAGPIELYYAYGIPLYRQIGSVNWSHLNNVLALGSQGIPFSPFQRLRLSLLGARMCRGFARAQVISAESHTSLRLIEAAGFNNNLLLSVNGSDDELTELETAHVEHPDDIATVVGTYSYKALDESLKVFRSLKKGHGALKLLLVGNPSHIPWRLRHDPDVIVGGLLDRAAVVERLRRSRYFISTTHVENSYNCAAEGIFLARESYISGIGPHRELLAGERFEEYRLPGVIPLLRVKRDELKGTHLRSWDAVIRELIAHTRSVLADHRALRDGAGHKSDELLQVTRIARSVVMGACQRKNSENPAEFTTSELTSRSTE